MKNLDFTKIIISISALAIAASAIYYFVIYIPQRDKIEQNRLEEKLTFDREKEQEKDLYKRQLDCSDDATKYLNKEENINPSFLFLNKKIHYNSNLKKCFISVNYINSLRTTVNRVIDVYTGDQILYWDNFAFPSREDVSAEKEEFENERKILFEE